MISSLQGIVQELSGDLATVDVRGVGYEVYCTKRLASRMTIGGEIRVTVFTDVQETHIRLFGFEDRGERQVFLLLNKVNGLGPRSCLEIVSQVDKRDLLRAIGAGDINALMRVRGVGKKKAERIVLELKDIVAAFSLERPTLNGSIEVESSSEQYPSHFADAISALEALGFNKRDAEKAVQQAAAQGAIATDSGVLVREALRFV